MRRLALAYAASSGEVVVFYRCADYDFCELKDFKKDGKTEVEYIL